jgi:acetyltransferase EpsM
MISQNPFTHSLIHSFTHSIMVFYGANGHAKVVIESWVAGGGKVTGIFDDNEAIREVLGYPVQGRYDGNRFPGDPLVISIGSNAIRQRLDKLLTCNYGMVIHPSAIVSPSCIVREGTVIMAGAIVNAGTEIGRHVIVNTSASVDHDCRIGDFAHISPNATLCGGITVGEGTQVGAGATVIPNLTIGKWAVIGAGSVVISDVPDHAVIAGVPGKVVGEAVGKGQ